QARLCLEALEDRLAPAVQLTYNGPGSVLALQELVSGATPTVTILEPSPGVLKIDLGPQTFDPTSTAAAMGLTYVSGAPATSNVATVDISDPNTTPSLQAILSGHPLTLGLSPNASGGLGNVAASAGNITVLGLNTSARGGNVDLRALGSLAVAP